MRGVPLALCCPKLSWVLAAIRWNYRSRADMSRNPFALFSSVSENSFSMWMGSTSKRASPEAAAIEPATCLPARTTCGWRADDTLCVLRK
jgi:hypothetical protein